MEKFIETGYYKGDYFNKIVIDNVLDLSKHRGPVKKNLKAGKYLVVNIIDLSKVKVITITYLVDSTFIPKEELIKYLHEFKVVFEDNFMIKIADFDVEQTQ